MDKRINFSQNSFLLWKETSLPDRQKTITKIAEILRQNQEQYSLLITQEMGKPISQSHTEIEKCAALCDYYAANLAKFLKPKKQKNSIIRFDPLGIILGIMPWNFPFWQVIRFAIPTIAAGNVVILKHSNNVQKCASAIEEIFNQACEIKNIFTNLKIDKEQIPQIIAHKNVKAVSLTGGKKAGQEVAKHAGANIKKCLLELGGNDPYIILKDADLDLAAKMCVQSRMINAGQSCIGAKRIIAVKEIHQELVEKLTKEVQKYQMGDPFLAETNFGPMANLNQRNEVDFQVQESIKKGAKLIFGGFVPNLQGNFYPPTILTNVLKEMPAYNEEIFGPIVSIINVEDEKMAIKIANDSEFGLGAGIFSKNINKARKLARLINSGNVSINNFVKSNPELPFGGVNSSGFGRELANFGMMEFVNVKTVTF
ncbi:MAG: succinate-semialdehyde dehydrogenase/glutarate-semialdehyde dehydrogenase [Lentimonas sp.]|jgi:succinate-semialdehyde dehydrogenase/glutarate-semialdehyde dehydrogenase